MIDHAVNLVCTLFPHNQIQILTKMVVEFICLYLVIPAASSAERDKKGKFTPKS